MQKSSMDTLDCQKDEQGVLMQIKPEISLEAKMTKLKLSYFRHIMRRQGSLGKKSCWENRSSRKREIPDYT